MLLGAHGGTRSAPVRRWSRKTLRWDAVLAQEVIHMPSSTEQAEGRSGDDFVPTDELVRRQGIEPITSAHELAQPDPWESQRGALDLVLQRPHR